MAKKLKAKPKSKPKSKSAAKTRVKPRIKAIAKPRIKAAIKPKAKPKVKPKAKGMTKSKVNIKAKAVKPKSAVVETPVLAKRVPAASETRTSAGQAPTAKLTAPIVKRIVNQMVERRRPVKRPTRTNQYSFMKAPGLEHAFEVGGGVEVFCDHEKSKERIRGWVKGIVVQVDNKMVAVQFRSNVYLTDGWMVPDRILWFPLNSEHMRLVPGKKPAAKDLIPDY
jgi:hypothetical protein